MGLPKEPRQKMINMMYLVLTAMLALNVSAEILNAFKTVNGSIINSNAAISGKNTITYSAFERELRDPQTMVNAKIWAPRADQAKKLSADLYAYIEDLKKRLADESGKVNENGEETYNHANLDAATRLMDNKGEGKKLYESLKTFKQSLLSILNPNDPDFAGNDSLKIDLIRARKDFATQLPLDLRVPPSQSGNAATGSDTAKNWTTNYFHMTPSIAAMTILSKFQNDIRNSEAQMIEYFHKKVGEVKVIFDQFQTLAQASSNYVMPGDKLTITAGVGAFSASAKPKISINGQEIALGADGTALFNTTAESAGEKTVTVRFEYTKPNGQTIKEDKLVKYTVGLPSGASVFLEKMNVLYIGEENPLTISGGSVGREKVHVSFTNGDIAPAGGSNPDEWIAKPKTQGDAKILVNAAGKTYPFAMRVKILPDPTGFIGTRKGGAISASEFQAIGGLIARLDNSEFQSPFLVKSYTLGAVGGNIPQYVQAINTGNRWSGTAASIVARATPGTNIFFDDIHVVGRDGRDRIISPMVFKLR
jgi:gliding motility-associated protein GldM